MNYQLFFNSFEYFAFSLSESLYNAYYLFNNENYGYQIIDVKSDSFEEIHIFLFILYKL